MKGGDLREWKLDVLLKKKKEKQICSKIMEWCIYIKTSMVSVHFKKRIDYFHIQHQKQKG